jgi:hypothetical protein
MPKRKIKCIADLILALDTIRPLSQTPTWWQALVGREREEIKGAGNIALRVDVDPETFKDWCNAHGFLPDSQGRMAFVNHVEFAYEKTGKGTIIE